VANDKVDFDFQRLKELIPADDKEGSQVLQLGEAGVRRQGLRVRQLALGP
jgi:hypothetical protein